MKDLTATLESKQYTGVFMQLTDGPVDELWTLAGSPAALDAVVANVSAPPKARLIAAEVLFRKQAGYHPPDAGALAAVYAAMLRTDVMANPWGMPGELDGPLGQHLVGIGEPAIAALRPLLDDDRAISYSGSHEATYGNGFKYRVKDFAAFFVATIRKLPFAVDEDPAVRDRAIAALRAAL